MREKIFLVLIIEVFCLLLILLISTDVKAYTLSIDNPLQDTVSEDIIGRLVDFVFTVSVILAPPMIVIAGYLFMTAAGNAEKVAQAKKLIT